MSRESKENYKNDRSETLLEVNAPLLQKGKTSDQEQGQTAGSTMKTSGQEEGQTAESTTKTLGQEEGQTTVSTVKTSGQEEGQTTVSTIKTSGQEEGQTTVSTRVNDPLTLMESQTLFPHNAETRNLDEERRRAYIHRTAVNRAFDDYLVRGNRKVEHGQPKKYSSRSRELTYQPSYTPRPEPISNEEKIPNYTCFSVFVILCCCPCVGICALIKARDARTKMAQGNRMGALKTARTARNLNIAGLVIGLVLGVFYSLMNYFLIPYILSNKS